MQNVVPNFIDDPKLRKEAIQILPVLFRRIRSLCNSPNVIHSDIYMDAGKQAPSNRFVGFGVMPQDGLKGSFRTREVHNKPAERVQELVLAIFPRFCLAGPLDVLNWGLGGV